MNRGPSFKYLFALTAISVSVFFLRYLQGSLDTYAYVIGILGVLALAFGFRQWWHNSKTHHQKVVGPENELQCLEEMARDYAQGRYGNRRYIERCFDEFEKAHKFSSMAVRLRLDAVSRDLNMGDALPANSAKSPP